MTQSEFLENFLGYVIKKAPIWLPEESTEEHMLDVMQKRLSEHNSEIREILCRMEGEPHASNSNQCHNNSNP